MQNTTKKNIFNYTELELRSSAAGNCKNAYDGVKITLRKRNSQIQLMKCVQSAARRERTCREREARGH